MDILSARELDTSEDYSGVIGGWGYPVKLSGGFVETLEGSNHINSCIIFFAENSYQDLIGTPTFGGGVNDLIFNLLAPNIIQRQKSQMYSGLKFWEQRIDELIVSVVESEEDKTAIIETIQYSMSDSDSGGVVRLPLEGEV